MSSGDDRATLVAVGDLQPDRKDPATLFEAVMPLFDSADFRFGQLECTISDQGVVRTDVRNPAHRVHPRNLDALTAANFDLVSYAGNNNLDYGTEAFNDTLQRLDGAGIRYVGAGRDLDAARTPEIVQIGGARVAFVNFCSILRDGYAATATQPGISPLKVATFYQPLENIYEQPGTPARTVTVVDDADLAAALGVITEAKRTADVCVALFHWGVHFTHDLSPYQPLVAQRAIDAGADIVIGTHPHCLQGIDVYKGRPIFYSLGNFAFEQDRQVANRGVGEYLEFYGLEMDQLKNHPHPTHCRLSMAAKIELEGTRISEVRVRPVYFSDHGRPELVGEGDEAFGRIRMLLEDLSAETGTSLSWQGDEARVELEKASDIDTRALVARRKVSYPRLFGVANGRRTRTPAAVDEVR